MQGIKLIGDPVLRQTSSRIRFPLAEDVKVTTGRLVDFLGESCGWGLSAPQLGESKRLFVMAAPKVSGEPLPVIGKPLRTGIFSCNWVPLTAIVNPEILGASEEMASEHETCLSVPSITALVPRHTWIKVRFQTLDGQKRIHRLEEHPARVFQHELDHLDGIFFLDRIVSSMDIMSVKEHHRQISQMTEDERDENVVDMSQILQSYASRCNLR